MTYKYYADPFMPLTWRTNGDGTVHVRITDDPDDTWDESAVSEDQIYRFEAKGEMFETEAPREN